MRFFHQVRKKKKINFRQMTPNSIQDQENPYQSVKIDRNVVYFIDVSLFILISELRMS
jgi:hypothetical protein